MALAVIAIPVGVWAGWKPHGKPDQKQLYQACNALLIVTALKLLLDGHGGYLA